jgi:MFS family permease
VLSDGLLMTLATAMPLGAIADIAPVALRGRYNGVVGMSFGAAAFVAPLAGTSVLERYGEPV